MLDNEIGVCAASVATTPAVDAPQTYLSDLLKWIGDNKILTDTQRRDFKSAITRICNCSGVLPECVPATPAAVNKLLATLNAAKCGVKPQTYWKMLSHLRSTFARYFQSPRPKRAKDGSLPPSWQALKRYCTDKKILIGLQRFIGYCADEGWEPDEIGLAHYEQFAAMVQTTLIRKHPGRLLRQVAVQWNRATKLVPGWPTSQFPVEAKRQGYTLKWGALPTPFRLEVEAWLKSRSEPDLTSEEARLPLRPRTIKERRFQTLQVASALVHSGMPVEAITSLATLVEPINAKAAMTFFLERAGKKPSPQTQALSVLLGIISKERCPPDENRKKKLALLRRKLAHRRHGMTEKNRQAIMPFKDPALVRQLMALPKAIVAYAETLPAGVYPAALVRTALCIEILLFCPIRIGTLVRLNLNTHFETVGSGRKQRIMLVIPAEDVKNKVDLRFKLQPRTVKLRNLYVKKYRSAFSNTQTSLLLPARNGHPVLPNTIGPAIRRTAKRFLGHNLTPHQFRHLMGMLFLKEEPGKYEVMRRTLGHKHLSTTTNFYLGQEADAAIEHFDHVISGLCGPLGKKETR